jgi:hypothetical protein
MANGQGECSDTFLWLENHGLIIETIANLRINGALWPGVWIKFVLLLLLSDRYED